MKKYKFTAVISISSLIILTGCAAPAEPVQTESGQTPAAAQQIQYRFADKEEGKKLLLSNTEYYDGFTMNELQFKMQKKEVSMDEYLAFAEEQVLDFSDEQKSLISRSFEKIEKIVADNGYHLPPLDEITMICTTMDEEGGAGAYTHGTQIYFGSSYLDEYSGENGDETYILYVLAHELFHCLTRCNPDFRADMYKLIHFTVQEKEYQLPPSVLEYFISNPDVEHHNAYAAFEINGKLTDCYLAFTTKKHFEEEGESFFDCGGPVMVPVDGTDRYYYPEDTANFYEVMGENTDYVIDPEECMAENFAFLIGYDKDGPEGKGYKTPEIIDGIRDYLQK